MVKRTDLDIAECRRLFVRDPVTGHLLTKQGKRASYSVGRGRWKVIVNGDWWFEHVVIMAMRDGYVDPRPISHINYDFSDNRIDNLCYVTALKKRPSSKAITQEYLRSILDYDPRTGIFTWRERPEIPHAINARRVGGEAGTINKNGYRVILINRSNRTAHRLAWLYVYGEFPKSHIDHIDRDRTNNSISNLRLATRSLNAFNRRAPKGAASAYRGVQRAQNSLRWFAQIRHEGKTHYLGSFDDEQEAAKAYRDAATSFYGEWVASFPELFHAEA